MTEERFYKIMSQYNASEYLTNESYNELIEFVKPHFSKPKLYQARVEIPEPVRDAGLQVEFEKSES